MDRYPIKGENRDRRREADESRQVVHPPLPYFGHRAGRKADERHVALLVKKARKKG